jgi:SAM-dependent methyltransferase
MPDEPQTWHYGLVARWWAEFNVASPAELAYYRAIIERYGQPALDLACGTGRLLLPLLRAGLDVDGCDVSPDMLAFCRAQAARDGLEPRLYTQASHELDLPRAYRTIYICDSFGIAGNGESLRRCYQHLTPGGALVFNLSLPYEKADNWRYWLPEERRKLPEAWPPTGNRRRTTSGDEIELRSRLVDFDPLEQRVTTQMRATLWREGVAVTEEEYPLVQHLYFRKELLALLARAGFKDVTVYGADGEAVANADDVKLVFVGRK